MSHCEYNEWWDKVEIGIHGPQWSPQADFGVMGGEIFSRSASHIPHQDCVGLDQCMQFTAAGLVQCLSIDIMNGETRLRLELLVYNGL